MVCEIIPYNSSHLASLTALLDSSFHIKSRNKTQFVQWKYFNAFQHNNSIAYIALDTNTQVVGYYVNTPLFLTHSGTVFPAMLCTDMTTRTDYRGQGLISQLSNKVYEHVKKSPSICSFGFSNSSGLQVDKHSLNYGYSIVAPFVSYYKPLIRKPRATVYTLTPASTFRKIPIKNMTYWKIDKSIEYLKWRYLDKPDNDYSIYTIQSMNRLVGYIILRFSGIRCYVYDIITSLMNPIDMIQILKSIEIEALHHRKRLAIYNVLDNEYWKTLFQGRNYFTRKHTSASYYLTVKIHTPQKELSSLLKSDNWLLMGGDII